MYHIFLTADEKYVKFSSVLMSSIIKNATQDYERRPFCFHILSDFISDTTKEKLKILQKSLSEIYPCEIKIHIQDDAQFEKYPSSGAAQNNKLSYYRLKFMSFLDDGGGDKCLYLDSDMLVLSDLRELFALDLKDKIVAVVGDMGSKRAKIKFKENNEKKTFYFDENYFNAGFLLINVKEYQKARIEERCEDLASKCFYIKSADQDLLNACIEPKKRLKLDFAWNFFTIAYAYVITKDDKKGYLNYTKEEFNRSFENPKILHLCFKPWKFLRSFVDSKGRNINELWWEEAAKTPAFNTELLELKSHIKDHLLYASLGALLHRYTKSFNLLKIAHLLNHQEEDLKIAQNEQNFSDQDFALFLLLGEMILHARAKKKGAFSVFLKALKCISSYEKYARR
ncbi:glycosyltransferase family 8 protein [Campylobacter upsaliensis]|uniref:glycosyltransferase family 8 protein n=1 Tax=Campylobacter upsaliensis TaxID=28080 RepID=UPI000E129155|nr:glycosyltransferase family 8 protein [Campylobacter upsaliensis]EAK3671810.1 glycosyltransferase family 8 protein [Campylobacter upsaliensis]EAL0497668.1 glycosyltransferase family 8 protein [Campylobacter upsaliensis]ECZ4670169.1 glycosyltransferase family 8 protein [Campylobacter upsaliensis]EDP6887756.1 glycosyltransferase family 8 protein [Campylobacter upsaliensis]EIJ6627922.1 glycosyltransferase family 8 protein [Campylobacter upsaliensis]